MSCFLKTLLPNFRRYTVEVKQFSKGEKAQQKECWFKASFHFQIIIFFYLVRESKQGENVFQLIRIKIQVSDV